MPILDSKRLLESLSRAQARYIAEVKPATLFDGLLDDLLELTDTEYGFIGEVLKKADGTPYLKTHAITNIAWNEETRTFYEENAPGGLEFFNLKSLFGAVMTSGEPVVANSPASDPRRCGIPEGHPPLNAFLGVPFYSRGEMVGMVGIANRPGGYEDGLLEELSPFVSTCANIIDAYRSHRQREVTQRSIEESEQRTRLILENLVEGITIIDDRGYIRQVNRATEQLFGYEHGELIGQKVNVLMPEPYRHQHDGYLANYDLTGVPKIIGFGRDVVGQRSDGSVFPVDLSVSELNFGGERLYVGVLRDITERKEIERVKNEFVSVVSHELRTPLTSIRGSLGLLEGQVFGPMNEKAREMVSIARENTDRLVRLINDILDLEKIEAQRMDLQLRETQIPSLTDEAQQMIAGFARQREVQVEVTHSLELPLLIDRDRMVQVLTNLISNAIKFSPQGGVVKVESGVEGRQALITVTDQGEGIPADALPHLFERFYQVDGSDTRAQGGTGLGLAIVKAIMEQHGGSVTARSEVGGGSTFELRLPLPTGDLSELSPTPGDLARGEILIVEDDEDVAETLRLFLDTQGLRSRNAPTIAAALKALSSRRPDAILLDLMLPDGSGLELLETLRARPETDHVPVLVLTGSDTSADDGAGFPFLIDWLRKPFDPRRLTWGLRKALSDLEAATALVVDDDPSIRTILSAQLSALGLATVEAGTGADALALVETVRPDVIVLDVGLPGMDGFEVVRCLSALGPDRQLPLVVYTGQTLSAEDRDRLRLGATRHLTKSRHSPAQLAEALQAVLGAAPGAARSGRE